jgi:hypothetical protein
MPRLSFSGFSRADEANARALFEGLALKGWSASDEASADVVLIDLDSIYGQMAWLRGLQGDTVAIGVTQALRSDTPYRLPSPFTAAELADTLADVALGLAAAKANVPDAPPAEAPEAPIAQVPPLASALPPAEPAAPAAPHVAAVTAPADPAPPATGLRTTKDAPATTLPPGAARLGARLARMNSGAIVVALPGLPDLVIDRDQQLFAPGKALKPLLPYATADLPPEAVRALEPVRAAAALDAMGDPQPLARLSWLLALGSGEGVVQGHGPSTRFVLAKWPQAEREFPKHFRIATVMMKGPATHADIVAASGASEAEVADYINAALAAGHASAS